jgi:hypothetical protein
MRMTHTQRNGVAVAAAILTIVMAGAIVWGFIAGDGMDELNALLERPWFIVSLIDVYIGFILVAGWIAFRERAIVAAPLIVALMLLGNVVSLLYVIYAALTSRGEWARFWGLRTN